MSLFPASWSKISSYMTCARQYAAFRVFKTVVEEKAEATIWGEEVHKALETARNENKPLEHRFKQYQPMLDKVDAIPGDHYVEITLAVDHEYTPCDYEGATARLRGSIDRLIISPDGKNAYALDFKTGKRKDFSRQLELYALFVFCWFPDVEQVQAIYLWTQGGKPTHRTIIRSEAGRIIEAFNTNLKDMEWSYANNAWPSSPSGLCGPNRAGTYKGCSVRDCPHNRRKD